MKNNREVHISLYERIVTAIFVPFVIIQGMILYLWSKLTGDGKHE